MAKVDNPHLNDRARLEEVLKGAENCITDPEVGNDLIVNPPATKSGEEREREKSAEGEEETKDSNAETLSNVYASNKMTMHTKTKVCSTLPSSETESKSKVLGVQGSIIRSVASHTAEVAVIDALFGLLSARAQIELGSRPITTH